MTKFYVSDMACNHCVARISKAMEEADIKAVVNLEDKTVVIDGCERCAAQAEEILDDLGFTPQRS